MYECVRWVGMVTGSCVMTRDLQQLKFLCRGIPARSRHVGSVALLAALLSVYQCLPLLSPLSFFVHHRDYPAAQERSH